MKLKISQLDTRQLLEWLIVQCKEKLRLEYVVFEGASREEIHLYFGDEFITGTEVPEKS